MIGLALLGLALLYLAAIGYVTALFIRGEPKGPARYARIVLVPLFLIVLPIADEIVGGIQFRRLCDAHDGIHVDRAKARGRTVYLADNPPEEVRGVVVPIQILPWRFVDATTGELVITYDELTAKGGWLARAIPLEKHEPITFRGACGFVDPVKLGDELGVRQIQRSELPAKGGRL